MKNLFIYSLLILNTIGVEAQSTFQYPKTMRDEKVIDNYHGTTVADPYRWLEDDNAEATKKWVTEQNKTTFSYLETIPFRTAIKDRLTDIWNFEKFGSPFKKGGKYYFFKNDGLQNQAVLYVQKDLNAPPSVVLDPNKLSTEGIVALGAISFNKQGNLLAYQLSKAGSDWQTIYVKDLETGKTLSDEIKWVKFSGIAWYEQGFFYSRYDAPKEGKELTVAAENQKVYFHKIGTTQEEDKLIWEDAENSKRGFGAAVTEDERYLVVTPWEGTSGNMLMIKDLKMEEKPQYIVENFENDWDLIDNMDNMVLFKTNYKAPHGRIVGIYPENPSMDNLVDFVPENETDVLQSAVILGDKIFVTYLHDASSLVRVYNLDASFYGNFKLPGIGTLGGFSGKKGETEAFFSFSSFTRPNTIYKLNTKDLTWTIFKTPSVKFTSDDYETKQVWYNSADGTRVPMFITHKKGIKLDGKNPTLLYGYGGFQISQLPQFSVSRAMLLEMGGVYAVANIRGGGEFGEKWHKSGTKDQKQNVFNDFIAAAEFLIKNNYTSRDYLAIQGGSNGGLLVGACMTQRPDLFKVCFPAVGVLDMLRYDKFTIGRAWSTDYGLSENPAEFKYLYAYSPLHNLKKEAYPATLITTADHDDRVVPAHSFKFAAQLQAVQQGVNPTFIRIETGAGHGAGKPTAKMIQETADILAFMYYNMGIKPQIKQ